MSSEKNPDCPECGCSEVWKAGLRPTAFGDVQRYLCRGCGLRFSDPYFSGKTNINEKVYSGSRQICVTLTEGMKNLARTEQKMALRKTELNNVLVNFSWHLKVNGKRDSTIETYSKHLEIISKYGDILDPESVKGVIASHYTENSTRMVACCAYDAFLKYRRTQWNDNWAVWEKPVYKPEHKKVFIPSDEELQIAINTGQRGSVIYSKFLYETGARDNEVQRVEWVDIDKQRKRVTIKASKNGNSRIVPISQTLIDLLFSLPNNTNLVFPRRTQNSRTCAFRARMKRLAKVYQNKRFLKIHLHTFRHCKALREYHKTKSILHVKKILGHKSINTTMRYVELYHELYDELEPSEYICETAMTPKEAKQLIEASFDYVCTIDGVQMFRKPKI